MLNTHTNEEIIHNQETFRLFFISLRAWMPENTEVNLVLLQKALVTYRHTKMLNDIGTDVYFDILLL